MPDMHFEVEGAEPDRFAAAPLLLFKLAVSETGAEAPTQIHALALRCQIRIEPSRRRYSPAEQHKLRELFGTSERWGQTLRPFLWTHVTVNAPPFTGTSRLHLPVPCSQDMALAVTKYFSALEDGDIPLCFLFSGSIFFDDGERLQVAQIPWEKEAYFRLPAATWSGLMDVHFPNTTWICLRRDTFERLRDYKTDTGLTTWEQTIERLLDDRAQTPSTQPAFAQ